MSRFNYQEKFEILPTNVREYYDWFKEIIEAHNIKDVTVRWVIPGRKFVVDDRVNKWRYSCSGLAWGSKTFQHPVILPTLFRGG